MAGERKGKTYEAIVFVVLNELKNKGKLKGNVFWNETPKGMTIEPDLVLGKDIDHPSHVFLITHSGSAKNSDMKFWRNMGELTEAKVFLATIPQVFNIAFDSVIKEDLKKIQEAAFDGQLLVGDTKYGDAIQNWVDANQAKLPTKAEEKSNEITSRLKTDKDLKTIVQKLSKDIQSLILKCRAELNQLWAMERKRIPGKSPTRKETFVRRGMSKLLVFEDLDITFKLYSGSTVKNDHVPIYLQELGLAKKIIGGYRGADTEIANVVNLLSKDNISSIYKLPRTGLHDSWLKVLRNLSCIDNVHSFFQQNYQQLCNPEKFYTYLNQVQKEPGKLLGLERASSPSGNWLYQGAVDIIKAAEGKKQGFGYAALIAIANKNKSIINDWLKTMSMPELKLKGQSAIVRGLTDWVNRLNTTHADSFSPTFQATVAWILSAELRSIGEKKLPTATEIKETLINNIYEQKLVTYREFDPVGFLIKNTILEFKIIKVRACFSEFAGLISLGGQTSVIKTMSTIINWQSAHGSHTNDKKKELCGRAVGLRYSWDNKSKKFIHRPGIKKLIFVVDGTWRQSDLDALCRAGWDEIFYPDEMDKLAKAIV